MGVGEVATQRQSVGLYCRSFTHLVDFGILKDNIILINKNASNLFKIVFETGVIGWILLVRIFVYGYVLKILY